MRFVSGIWVRSLCFSAIYLGFGMSVLSLNAQQKSDFAGEFAGSLGPYHVKLHIAVDTGGGISAKVDSPDQGLFDLACTDIAINGPTISLSVPNLRGEWMGTLSSDHDALTGIWKQGRSMPLNFTRVGAAPASAAASTAAPAAVVPTAGIPGTAPSAVPSPSGHPSCEQTIGVSYWNGTRWVPMIQASHVGADRGVSFTQGLKNPFNPMAGYTHILKIQNPSAALVLPPSPSFCFRIGSNQDPTMVRVGFIDVKRDHRELETCTGMCASKGRTRTTGCRISVFSRLISSVFPTTPSR